MCNTCAQKYLKKLVRTGCATDISKLSQASLRLLARDFRKVSVSRGIYGINGVLLEAPTSDHKYVVLGRCATSLFSVA